MTTTMPEAPPPVGRPALLAPVLAALGALPAPPLGAVLAPLDALRSRTLRLLAPRVRSLVVDRQLRVAAAGSLFVLMALVSSSTLTLGLLAIGPIVWGVPHIVADFRYLVARPGFHRRPWMLVAFGIGIAAGGLGFGLRGALVGAILALLLSRAPMARKAGGAAVLGAVLALSQWAGPAADMVFAHAHNLVAVALWWVWRPRGKRLSLLPLAAFAVGVTLILSGALDPIVAGTHALSAPWTGLSARGLAWGLSPDPRAATAGRFLVLYAFGQAVHYVMWLRLIPEDDRPSPTPRSYAQTYRALRADLGPIVLWVAGLSAVALAIWAMGGPGRARNDYIRLAFFHGYLELAAAAVLWAEGAFRGSPGAAPSGDPERA